MACGRASTGTLLAPSPMGLSAAYLLLPGFVHSQRTVCGLFDGSGPASNFVHPLGGRDLSDFPGRGVPPCPPRVAHSFRPVDEPVQQGASPGYQVDVNAARCGQRAVERGVPAGRDAEPDAFAGAFEWFEGKATVLGNVDCTFLLPFGSEEEVERAVMETIRDAAPGGGYIISSSNSIHPGVKPENYIAMVKAARKYGAYPINL